MRKNMGVMVLRDMEYLEMMVIRSGKMLMSEFQITTLGFSFVVMNLITMLYYNPTLDQDCPSWVYYSWAIGLFLYQTFDAVDGSQAYVTPDEKDMSRANELSGDVRIRVGRLVNCLTMVSMQSIPASKCLFSPQP